MQEIHLFARFRYQESLLLWQAENVWEGPGGEGCIVLFLLTNHGWSDTTLAVPARPCGEPDEEDEEDGGGDDQDQDELEPGGQAAGGQHAVHVVVRGVVDVIMHVIMHVIVVVDVSVHAECL